MCINASEITPGGDTMLKGIDVSSHQGEIDWSKVNVDFAILRAGYGKTASQKDTAFEQNYTGCKKNSIPIGCYWFSYALSEKEAVQEANAFLSVIQGKQFEYPVYYDVEGANQLALGKEKVSAIIRAFLSVVEKAGYWVGLYMSASPLSNYVDEEIRTRYAVWVAEYTKKNTYDGQFGIWQYGIAGNTKFDTTNTGSVSGITGECDLDYCYTDYPTITKKKGLNGYSNETTPSTPKKTVCEIAQEVLDGKWGNNEERKQKLTAAGYDYSLIQTIVNAML